MICCCEINIVEIRPSLIHTVRPPLNQNRLVYTCPSRGMSLANAHAMQPAVACRSCCRHAWALQPRLQILSIPRATKDGTLIRKKCHALAACWTCRQHELQKNTKEQITPHCMAAVFTGTPLTVLWPCSTGAGTAPFHGPMPWCQLSLFGHTNRLMPNKLLTAHIGLRSGHRKRAAGNDQVLLEQVRQRVQLGTG